ncbi:EF-P lysine aminoacylase GenX [Mangrovimicrobium sediminis]|uniref:EF-P lysine aminoacylase GenX n=1 Tax=Mangrovimicrobium sediminis TaxID=2562682 RepID=A0A4Z0LYZ5_9GAMM|nr:EF-P lysine aminoacylase EpmA [Haliea sp. SAOS-164]TGD72603.1 EF-P lysine aminoacylase GenX [Haliea sp. SAOS-164]
MDWQPSASLEALRQRAALLQRTRYFFARRGVLEVETPLLCSAGVSDPAIENLAVERGTSLARPRYLQSSPEYAMKRLLAAGSGPIYQLARAFRDGEAGARHNPEFSLLEWYRPGFDLGQLMAEVAELVLEFVGERPVEYIAYRDLFLRELDLDPLLAPPAALEARARAALDVGDLAGNRDLWLDLLMSHLVEPALAGRGLCFVYDYPASQAALARLETRGEVSVARRFELYVDGVELANGYHELTDAAEQRRRFAADNARRAQHGQPLREADDYLLAALASADGLPDCCGVALGFDRLLMLASGINDIRQTLAFDWSRC